MAAVDRPQEGSGRQVLKRADWLIAQRIRWEPGRRWEGAPVPQQPLPCQRCPPPVCSPYISLSRLYCHSRHRCHLLLFKGFCVLLKDVKFALSALSSSRSLKLCPLTLYPSLSRLLYLASLLFHVPVIFLLPCVHCDMNAAAAPPSLALDLFPVSPSPLCLPPLKQIPHCSLRMGRCRRITCSPLSHIPRWRNVPL